MQPRSPDGSMWPTRPATRCERGLREAGCRRSHAGTHQRHDGKRVMPRWSPVPASGSRRAGACSAPAFGGQRTRGRAGRPIVTILRGPPTAGSPHARGLTVAHCGDRGPASDDENRPPSCARSPNGKWLACVAGNSFTSRSGRPAALFGNPAPSAILSHRRKVARGGDEAPLP